MNAATGCFRLSPLLLAAALLAATPGAFAQSTEGGSRDQASANPAGASSDTAPAEARRERGKRHNDADKKTETAAPFPAQPPAKAANSELICKYDTLSGTKMKRKVCGTAEQWAAWRRQNQDNVEETTRKTRQSAGGVARPDVTQRQMPPGGGL